jgi:hypothetical protein
MQLTVPRPHALAAALGFTPQPAAAPAPARASRRDRERRSGGPEDRALYACSCGVAFKASVTTSVGCPHCGQTQAW